MQNFKENIVLFLIAFVSLGSYLYGQGDCSCTVTSKDPVRKKGIYSYNAVEPRAKLPKTALECEEKCKEGFESHKEALKKHELYENVEIAAQFSPRA